MSFREKSAWISLMSILLVSGFFFLHVPWTLAPPFNPQLFWGLLYCFAALVAIEVVAHVVVVFRAPQDARAPKDERELSNGWPDRTGGGESEQGRQQSPNA